MSGLIAPAQSIRVQTPRRLTPAGAADCGVRRNQSASGLIFPFNGDALQQSPAGRVTWKVFGKFGQARVIELAGTFNPLLETLRGSLGVADLRHGFGSG